MSGLALRRLSLFLPLLTVAAAACAASRAGQRPTVVPGVVAADTRIWQALGDGDDGGAERLLGAAARAGDAGGQGSAAEALANASLAFERGDVGRAITSYLAVLDRAAAGESTLAAMAAGRLTTLLEEHPGPDADRRAVEERILALSPDRWSWQARYSVASLWDRIARRRADPALLARIGARAGCIAAFTVTRPLGGLPHLDLDGVAAAGGPARSVAARGCRAAVPSQDGRPGAQRILIDVDASRAGTVDVVVGFRGEGRLIIDGGPAHAHGGEWTYGPQLSATRASWAAGRHRLELRLATYGGRPELMVMVVPAVDEGVGAAPPFATALATAYVANQTGDTAAAEAAGARLEAAPRFALGTALAAALIRDDPSLPPAFARDRARTLLRRALSVDPRLARARNTLANLALDEDRPREALEEARLAADAAPAWWLPRLTLHTTYEARGLQWDADHALDEALARGPRACAVVQAALGHAETQRDGAAARRLADDEVVCGVTDDDRIARLRRRGDWDEAERLLRLAVSIEPDPQGVRDDLGRLLLARGRAREAMTLLESHLERTDGEATVAWADAAVAAGEGARARARLASVLAERPDLPQVVRAARALGVPLPLDAYRLDGRAVIRAFEASGRRYAGPAVVVLDRTVTRVFDSGASMTLTHEIVRVQSKDAIEKWGEVSVPQGAEVLTLRTHKPDGTTREPEEVAGKDAISAADLAIGDYLEKETLELDSPHEALGPTGAGSRWGYLGDRFYFQSFDAPLDRSEYLLVTSPAMADAFAIDSRAGAPAGARAAAAEGTLVTTFAARQVPQLFAERSAVPVIEHVPSVRVSAGATWTAWARFLHEQMYGAARDGKVLDPALAQIRAQAAGASPEALAAAVTAWVGQNIESDDDLRGAATVAVASGRGNRVSAIQALARRLGLTADVVLGRSRFIAEGADPTPIQEADDFAEVLLRFDLPSGSAYVDPRLKHAPFRYLAPGIDGGRVLDLATATFQVARSANGDGRAVDLRAVDLTIRLGADGQATGEVIETVRGWPALEWAEIVDRFGADETKLRQDFEQRWLGVHFPGAVLKDLRVEILGSDGRERLARGSNGVSAAAAPLTAATVRLLYTFVSPRFAALSADRLRFAPTFFRALAGRRYATEPRRSTALMTGFEVPTTVEARIVLPPGARPEAPPAQAHEIDRQGRYLFREERRLDAPEGAAATLQVRREARLAIQRIPPASYPTVAADLRAADVMEGEEIVLRLPRRTSERRP